MAKEEYETPLIDVYNRSHMDALHEDGGWYHRFLPDGVFLEDLGQIIEEELIKAYNQAETEVMNSLKRESRSYLQTYLLRQIQKTFVVYYQRNLLLHGLSCLLRFKERYKSCMTMQRVRV